MIKEINIFFSLLLGAILFSLLSNASAMPTLTEKVLKGYELAQDWDLNSAEKLSNSLIKDHPKSGDAHFLNARIEYLKGTSDTFVVSKINVKSFC